MSNLCLPQFRLQNLVNHTHIFAVVEAKCSLIWKEMLSSKQIAHAIILFITVIVCCCNWYFWIFLLLCFGYSFSILTLLVMIHNTHYITPKNIVHFQWLILNNWTKSKIFLMSKCFLNNHTTSKMERAHYSQKSDGEWIDKNANLLGSNSHGNNHLYETGPSNI